MITEFKKQPEESMSETETKVIDNLHLVEEKALEIGVSAAISDREVFDSMVSCGTIGLIKAVRSFKPDRHIKFEVYALRYIENEMLMYLRTIRGGKK